MRPMRMEKVKLEDIKIAEDRIRKDFGDVQGLAVDLQENGLICPIAVVGPDPPYTLAAGERRYHAASLLGWKEIPCHIYERELSRLELRMIELAENLKRKNLTYLEEINLKREIHKLQQEAQGKGLPGPGKGHATRDTAALVGRSKAGVAEDIRLAEAIEQLPEIDWASCKTKVEARKLLARVEEGFVRQEIAKRASKALGPKSKNLVDAYFVGDFFEHVRRLPAGVFDLVEVDPPFGIGLPDRKLKRAGAEGMDKFKLNYGESYNEIDANQYPEFITRMLTELYRVMNDRSWLILWFAPEPWFQTIYEALMTAGFKTRRIPGLWVKPTGQTHHPDIHLASCYEMFYYAYKGDAVIDLDSRGRSNVFPCRPVSPARKVHPTEKPVALYEQILGVFANEGARVYVPFCGSGNTLIAAHNLNMQPIGCDLGQDFKDGYTTKVVEGQMKDQWPLKKKGGEIDEGSMERKKGDDAV